MHDPPRFHCKTKANNFKKAVLSYTELMVVPPKTIQPVMKSIPQRIPQPKGWMEKPSVRPISISYFWLVLILCPEKHNKID